MFTAPTPKTVQEAAFQSRVLDRANLLFVSGYRYERMDFAAGPAYVIITPEGEQYIVDPLLETCTCECFKEKKYCKHALAIQKELDMVAEYEAQQEREAAAECANGVDYRL